MCLLIPPKPKKATKTREPSKPALAPSIPRYSRMPKRPCCAPASSTLPQADAYMDYLQQQYPDDQGALHQYTTQLGLHHLDDTLHAHADQNHQATMTVGKGVKEIHDRLERIEESFKETGREANEIWEFCDGEKRRRWEKTEGKRKEREEETKRENGRLKELVEKSEKTQGEKKGLGEADVLKLLAEREMRLELENLRLKHHGVLEKKTDGFISEAQLQKILDQREQAKELQRLQQGQQKGSPQQWLERPDLVKILDQRDREREFARLQKLENTKLPKGNTTQEDESQEQMLRKIFNEYEQRQELERLKTFEAEALSHKAEASDNNVHPSLPEIERLIDDILEKHDRKQDRERSRESLRSDRRRQASPRSQGGEDFQQTIDEILSLLLNRRSADHAADVLENLLHRPQIASARTSARKSDRQWILTEVLRYLDSFLVNRPHENNRYGQYPEHHGDGTHKYGCGTTNHIVQPHTHAHASPPPSYQSPRPTYPDSAGTRRWSPERPHVRFDSKPAPSYWERTSQLDHGYRPR